MSGPCRALRQSRSKCFPGLLFLVSLVFSLAENHIIFPNPFRPRARARARARFFLSTTENLAFTIGRHSTFDANREVQWPETPVRRSWSIPRQAFTTSDNGCYVRPNVPSHRCQQFSSCFCVNSERVLPCFCTYIVVVDNLCISWGNPNPFVNNILYPQKLSTRLHSSSTRYQQAASFPSAVIDPSVVYS